ncbi:hypothetical protein POTOM_016555 [Populus tomentosa]|uniref:Protein kinase domain-containing protein n=1 Tax=Populus tomentosa TaxID=118781 RepID=A0A8X8D3Y3_POPTO|nr:hypothetical protein POTOM_016555 [Populus tomentosa]
MNTLLLVNEFIENGNLSQHLRSDSGKVPLPWSARVRIALNLARGLEYIHEHTVPVYIHHDVKSANILIDKNFRGKFEDVLRQPDDPRENLPKLVDPRLGDDYPLDSVCKMALLARACTHTGNSSTKTKHEISCGSTCDTFIHTRMKVSMFS